MFANPAFCLAVTCCDRLNPCLGNWQERLAPAPSGSYGPQELQSLLIAQGLDLRFRLCLERQDDVAPTTRAGWRPWDFYRRIISWIEVGLIALFLLIECLASGCRLRAF